MNDHQPDDDFLRDALEDAVADVEPVDRLTAIRTRTRTARRTRRSWYVAGTAGLAAAAVVVAVAVVTSGDDAGTRPDVATSPTPTDTPTDDSPVVDPPAETTPVYYVGPGSDGPDGRERALYRYFEPAGDPLELLMSTPSDPDYQTSWEPGSLQSFRVLEDRIVVQGDPAGTDELAMQQLVYTLQAATNSRLPVQVTNPFIDTEPVDRADPLEVLSHVSISDPGERYAYSGSFTARGVGNGYEGTIGCRLVGDGGQTAWSGVALAGAGEALEPWTLDVDLTGVAPGGYVLVCQDEDPTAGAEGIGAFTDDRTIVVTEPADATTPPDPGTDAPATPATRVFYVGDGPAGAEAPDEVLYGVDVTGDGDPLSFLMSQPDDPDYRTRWPAGSLVAYDVEDDRIAVLVSDDAPVDDDLAFQQLSFTLHAATRSDLPVEPAYASGVDQPVPVQRERPALEVLSLMNVLRPAEGATYASGSSFEVTGLANSFEGYAGCDLLDPDGTSVWQGATMTGALREDRLSPWELTVELRGVAPGDHTLSCYTDDPIGGGEGRGQDVDTRSITVTQA